MSSMLENLTNPAHKEQLEDRMSRIKEDPSLKPILDEIESGGPAAMMRCCTNFFSVIFIFADKPCLSLALFKGHHAISFSC